jgi:hypothetical protein
MEFFPNYKVFNIWIRIGLIVGVHVHMGECFQILAKFYKYCGFTFYNLIWLFSKNKESIFIIN